VVVRPDHAWVCNLTYIKVRGDFLYLAMLMDIYMRSVRGCDLTHARMSSGRYGASPSILPTNSGKSLCLSICRITIFSPV